MSCSNITSGLTIGCNDSQGGLEAIFIANGPVESFAETAGVVSAITVGGVALAPADFFKFESPRQTSSISESVTATQENGTVTYEQSASMILTKLEAVKRNQLLLMSEATTMVVIAKDNNGLYWSIGLERGAYLTTSTNTSGVAYADRSGYEISLNGVEKFPMFEIDGAIVEA